VVMEHVLVALWGVELAVQLVMVMALMLVQLLGEE